MAGLPTERGRTGVALLLAVLMAGCGSDSMESSAGPVSVANSVVSVSRGTVISGTAAQLTLEARDAFDQRLTSGGLAVAFSVSGGTSGGTIGPVTDGGDGSYTASFTGVTAGTPATVSATIDGAPVTQPLPTIQVTPGPVSPVVSAISVSPATVLVGESATIELVTRDANGNDLGTGGRQVLFTLGSGTSAGTLGATTDHGDGRYAAMFTATGRGTPLLIGATVDGVPVSTTSPTVTVAAGVSPDSSVLELSSDTVAIGGSVTLTLRVIDSAGVPRTSGGETVVFTALTGAGTGQGTIDSTTDHDDGSYTANFTASGSGSPVTIGVTLAGQPMGGPPQSITILANPISPQHSTVEVADDSVAAGGTVLLTLVVRDLDSNQVTGGGLSVVFTASSDGGNSVGGIGSTTDHSDGRYTATFTGRLIGSPTTIGATINDSSLVQMLDSLGVSHLPAITVTPGPHAVDSSLFTVTPSTLTLGDSAELLLEVRDGFGNPVGQGGRNVVFARVGGAGVSVGTITGVTDSGDGTYRAFYRADSAGSADTLTATVDGVTLDSIRPTVLVSCIAGPVSVTASLLAINDATIPSGVGTTITVRVRDAVGCPITAPHAIVISATGGTSTGTIGAVSDQGDGSYTATFTGELAGTPTTLAATIDGTPISGPAVTVSVTPGDISPQTSSVQVIPAAVDSGGHASVTLQARDAAGNDLVTGGRIVTIIPTSPSPHGSLGPTTDLGNGHYAAVYTASVVEPGVPDLFTADIEGTAILSPPAGVEVVAGTISPDQSLVTTSAASVMVGDSVLVTLVGRDASGRALVTGDRVVAIGFTLAGGSSAGAFGPVQNLGNGSYAAWLTGTGAGTAVTINATIGGVAVTTGLPVVTVVP